MKQLCKTVELRDRIWGCKVKTGRNYFHREGTRHMALGIKPRDFSPYSQVVNFHFLCYKRATLVIHLNDIHTRTAQLILLNISE